MFTYAAFYIRAAWGDALILTRFILYTPIHPIYFATKNETQLYERCLILGWYFFDSDQKEKTSEALSYTHLPALTIASISSLVMSPL